MNEIVNFFEILISLAFLVVLLFWLYRDYRVDKFRQDLFVLRDSFFDQAANDKLDFSDPAYIMLRSTMNGAIQFAHRFNLLQIILFIALMDRNNIHSSFHENFETALSELSEEQKEMVKAYRIRFNLIMMEHVIMTSPLLIITVVIPVGFLLKAKNHVAGMLNTFQSPLEKIDNLAWLTGRHP